MRPGGGPLGLSPSGMENILFEFGKSICFREGFGGFCFSETGDDDDDDNEDARTCSYTSPICFSLLPNFLLEHAPQLFFSLPGRNINKETGLS